MSFEDYLNEIGDFVQEKRKKHGDFDLEYEDKESSCFLCISEQGILKRKKI